MRFAIFMSALLIADAIQKESPTKQAALFVIFVGVLLLAMDIGELMK